ncbi:MAG TPA: zinc-ribbon domain-containing protein [Thermodesulfobacteriota bacterium]|nr:zinc-ribbon domain-containing protein [Thermodesulfobacteriota bacterium]
MEKIFILIIVMAVAVFISLPFFRGRVEEDSEDPDRPKGDREAELKRLNAEKESLLAAIKEVGFDYEVGKLTKEDYQELETKYKTEAALLLQNIEKLEAEMNDAGLKDGLEEEIRKTRRTKLADDKGLEEEILRARKLRSKGLEHLCSKCGASYQPEDRFCSKCGTKLGEDQTRQAY